MTHVTYRLTAKNLDQLRKPTLGNRVRLPFFTLVRISQLASMRSTRICYWLLQQNRGFRVDRISANPLALRPHAN